MFVPPDALKTRYLVAMPEQIWARTCFGTIGDGSSWDDARTAELEVAAPKEDAPDEGPSSGEDDPDEGPSSGRAAAQSLETSIDTYLYVSLELGQLYLPMQTSSGRHWYGTRWRHHITIGYLVPVPDCIKGKLQEELDKVITEWRNHRVEWHYSRPGAASHCRMMKRFCDPLSERDFADRRRPCPSNPCYTMPIMEFTKERLKELHERRLIDFVTYPTRIVENGSGEKMKNEDGSWLKEDIPLNLKLLYDYHDRMAYRYCDFVDIERQARQLCSDVTMETAQYHPIDVTLQTSDESFPKLHVEAEVTTLCAYLRQACVTAGCWHWGSKEMVNRHTALLPPSRWHITPQVEREGPFKNKLHLVKSTDGLTDALFNDYECVPGHGHQEPRFRRPLLPEDSVPEKIKRRPWRQ